MSKHRRRLCGPTKDRPLVHCLWIDDRLGVFTRSTLLRKGFLKNDYEHTNLGIVIAFTEGRGMGHVISH